MSGTILYLAIVAIWVCILVPRWMRRSHPAANAHDDVAGDTAGADEAPVGRHPGTPASPSGTWPSPSGTWVDTSVTMASATVTGTSRWSAGERPEPGRRPSVPQPAREYTESLTVTAESLTITADSPGRPAASPPPTAASSPERRAHVLQARRRLLSTLLALAAIAVTFTVIGLAQWWVCVPPALMLAFYLPLLRQAALVDVENHRRRQEASRAYPARQRAQALRPAEAARAAEAAQPAPASALEPDAQIIDISARVADQLYDQYADAAVRAVGD